MASAGRNCSLCYCLGLNEIVSPSFPRRREPSCLLCWVPAFAGMTMRDGTTISTPPEGRAAASFDKLRMSGKKAEESPGSTELTVPGNARRVAISFGEDGSGIVPQKGHRRVSAR
jgi:hypothetical protein